MLSIDTNLLFHAFAADRPEHGAALAWLTPLHASSDVVLSEFVLVEFYRLLRNPVVSRQTKSAADAARIIAIYRSHPRWRITGFTRDSESLHDDLWHRAAASDFAYRRIYDARLALSLRQSGVTEFATANVKDFEGFGFTRVWNPLAGAAD
jgi:toxin-antitoxin system PIN domain toxin